MQTGQNALPGPRDVPLRGRASAMHAGFRGKRPTKPFPETQRCPFPGQPAETSMTKHPEGAGTGHRFLAPGCAQAEARPPRKERRGHTPERMFSRKRPCVLCGKIPLLPDDGENSAPQAFRQKKHGRGASAAIRAGKAFAPQGCAGAKAAPRAFPACLKATQPGTRRTRQVSATGQATACVLRKKRPRHGGKFPRTLREYGVLPVPAGSS